ncbi:MAG TPA: N,N'-diacetylchitobiose phosphorylase [Verrucomicrobiae bacterium]|nr:N,N'-diacetylchitobiose phosphorylase [Verrucomicrobiae bacterium]
MRYGYFDDKNREYVIERPDTPRSWANYLGSTEYGAIITNNAGGYSFFMSAAQGRLMRLRFDDVPLDQPGRYIYLRDKQSGDYWSNAWQPVGKPLDQYKTTCRHGTAYTTITSRYANIETETTYFVPLGKRFECWLLKVTNNDTVKRNLSLFTFVEYPGTWHCYNDFLNLQYSHGIVKMDFVDGMIDYGSSVLAIPSGHSILEGDQNRHSFLAFLGGDVVGFDADRDVFITPYRGYANPMVVEQGRCTGSLAFGDDGCGSIQIDVDLEPGESRELVVLMGIGKAAVEGKKTAREFGKPARVKAEFQKLKDYWHNRIEGLSVHTPDPAFNSMMNMWSPFNCLTTYSWSRMASLIYSGERDGLGYRDTVQDFMGVMHLIPQEAVKRLELMITGQCSTGGALPIVMAFTHKPGKEKLPREDEYRSDDCLWLFNAVTTYVKETGDVRFFQKKLPYADKGSDTVIGHLRRAIEFNLKRTGRHGLPSGLYADWNDCLRLGSKGESIFVSLQVRYGLKTYAEICGMLKLSAQVKWAEKQLETLDKKLDKHAWDGQWYVRAYKQSGEKIGSKENKQGSIYLNTQSWGVLSGHADSNRAEQAMNAVNKQLATDYGLMLCAPPYENIGCAEIRSILFNKGVKENGSIFNHTQGWAVMAETVLGHGDRAFRYFRSSMPAAMNDKAEIRGIEPYVYSQYTHSTYSARTGTSRVPWLTGAASWACFAATQYVLGIRPDYQGLRIDPCIPSAWKEFSATRRFRNKTLRIKVVNPSGVQKGVKKITLNQQPITGNLIPFSSMKKENDVLVEMG